MSIYIYIYVYDNYYYILSIVYLLILTQLIRYIFMWMGHKFKCNAKFLKADHSAHTLNIDNIKQL